MWGSPAWSSPQEQSLHQALSRVSYAGDGMSGSFWGLVFVGLVSVVAKLLVLVFDKQTKPDFSILQWLREIGGKIT